MQGELTQYDRFSEGANLAGGYMPTSPAVGDGSAAVEQYLRRYLLDSRMMQAEMRRRERREMMRGASPAWDDGSGGESGVLFCRARMYEVQEFIRSLPDGEEKLFLYNHYICGESVVRIAEDLDISDRSAYRLRRRALDLAAQHYRDRHAAASFMAMRV